MVWADGGGRDDGVVAVGSLGSCQEDSWVRPNQKEGHLEQVVGGLGGWINPCHFFAAVIMPHEDDRGQRQGLSLGCVKHLGRPNIGPPHRS